MIDNESACDAKIPSWKYEDIERRVTKLYEEQSINRLPIDPFEIIKKRGYMPIPFSAFEKGDLPECANEDNDAFSFYAPTLKTYVIVYNDKKPLRRIRFTLMHEIGHIDLGHKCESDLARKMADYYAGYALAPSPLVEKFASEKIADIASVFKVSIDCADVCSQRYQKWLRYGGSSLKDYEIDLINRFK